MGHKKDDDLPEIANPSEQRSFKFDKFMDDLERRENIRRESCENTPNDNNQANRLRDARNREQVNNRIRWNR